MKMKSKSTIKPAKKNKLSPSAKNLGKSVVKAKRKEILEFYYMTPQKTDAKDISLCIETIPQEKIEVWRELNLLEIVMTADSLIFQDAKECFEDPLDLEYIREHHIETIYQISYDKEDSDLVKKVMKEILEKKGGFICSDTEDFEPTYDTAHISNMQ